MNSANFSVLMSVYKNDRPEWVRMAVESVTVHQTIKPSELLIVVDGPVSDTLSKELSELQEEISYIRIEWCQKNRGLGFVLHHGLQLVNNEIVARMDSDDIASSNRFELQLAAFEKDEDLSVLGGTIAEFIDSPNNIVASRCCPIDDNSIKQYMKSRCGFNHMAVMFKRSEVLKAGSYQDWHYNEDYYLWLRMMLAGCKFSNLPDTLVNVRVGRDMYKRRGGWKYFKSELGLQNYMLKNQIIGLFRYVYNVLGRLVIQVLMPNSVRGVIFQKILRK